MSTDKRNTMALIDRYISAGTDADTLLPMVCLDGLGELGINAPDQRYLLYPETAKRMGACLLLAADPALALHAVTLVALQDAAKAARRGDWAAVAKAGEALLADTAVVKREIVQQATPEHAITLDVSHLRPEQVKAFFASWQRLREKPPVGPILVAGTEREALHELLRRGTQLVADGQSSPLVAEWLEQVRNMLDVEGT